MIKADEFRVVMRHWAASVAIATCIVDNSPHGMTVNSFTSVSADPAIITVSLAKGTRTLKRVLNSGLLGISVLSVDQRWIAERFAGKEIGLTNRFEGIDTFTLTSEVPFIEGGLAYFDCALIHQYEMLASILLVANVLAIKEGVAADPLVYTNRQYGMVKLL